jgi:hypothetical protein
MGFVGRWLGQAISIGFSLAGALAAMQLPAMTHAYRAALLQVSEDIRRDVDQREDSARRFYHLVAANDEAVIVALKPFEPSNAEGLTESLKRERNLRAAYDRITSAPPILQPVIAAADFIEDSKGYKAPVLGTMLSTFTPEIVLSPSAACYGVLGLVFGSFLAQLVIAGFTRLMRIGPLKESASRA